MNHELSFDVGASSSTADRHAVRRVPVALDQDRGSDAWPRKLT